MRLKTEYEIERDLYKAAAKIRDLAAKKGLTDVANAPLELIVKRLKVIRKRDGIGGFSRWH